MREMLQFYIDGRWVDPVAPMPFDVIDPSTEEVCGRISLGSEADVDRAVAAAKKAFPGYARSTREQRIDLLQAILDEFDRRADERSRGNRTAVAALERVDGRAGPASGAGFCWRAAIGLVCARVRNLAVANS